MGISDQTKELEKKRELCSRLQKIWQRLEAAALWRKIKVCLAAD